MKPMHVQIDELVIEGLGPDAGDVVRRAVERELQRLMATEGPLSDRAADAIDAGTFDGGQGAEAAGVRLARAIHGKRR